MVLSMEIFGRMYKSMSMFSLENDEKVQLEEKL